MITYNISKQPGIPGDSMKIRNVHSVNVVALGKETNVLHMQVLNPEGLHLMENITLHFADPFALRVALRSLVMQLNNVLETI